MLSNKINPTPDNPDSLIPENISLVSQHTADLDKAQSPSRSVIIRIAAVDSVESDHFRGISRR